MTGQPAYAKPLQRLAAAIAIVMAIYHMWILVPPLPDGLLGPSGAGLVAVWNAAFFGPANPHIFRAIHLLFAISLVFLWFRARAPRVVNPADEKAVRDEVAERSTRPPTLLDGILLALAASSLVYVFVEFQYIFNRTPWIDDPRKIDWVLGVALIALVIEATRRLMGWALPVTALLFLGYALLVHRVEPGRLLDQLYLTTEGIFGQPLGVSASYVMIFVLFGAFMERTGTGQLFMDFAMSLTGHTAGGPGKVSVVSSSLFGTISGSAVANVMVDGPISIPLMKRSGFRPHFAAGVEAVASTGGQLMPPIMGAAAFVMAEFLRVGYGQVIIWAIVPSLLYYLACFGAVHFEAKRQGLVGLKRSELPVLTHVLAERGHLFIPVIIILIIMYSGYSTPLAALIATLLCFPVAAMRASTRGNVTLRNVLDALIDGARNALAVALACACAGIVIGVVNLTGIGLTFTQLVAALAQNTLLLALILTMAAGIVLGMGMPTTPAYIIMTALLIPALIKLKVPEPAAHMFAFYFAILSAITPPVALAVYAAAGIAKSDLWKTGWAAVRIGAAGFIVPFMFVYEPALLMIGPWPQILQASITAGIGCILLAAGLHGYFLARCNALQCALLIAAALLLVNPSTLNDILGLGLASIVAIWQRVSPVAEPASAGKGGS